MNPGVSFNPVISVAVQRGWVHFPGRDRDIQDRQAMARMCMRRLRAERAGEKLGPFPPRQRTRKMKTKDLISKLQGSTEIKFVGFKWQDAKAEKPELFPIDFVSVSKEGKSATVRFVTTKSK